MKHDRKRAHTLRVLPLLAAAALGLGLATQANAQTKETVGGGTVTTPAVGPAPSFTPPGVGKLVLVKNWHFGADGTITNYADMNANFQYHDQFNNDIANGLNDYGSLKVAPDDANAVDPGDIYYYDPKNDGSGGQYGKGQPIEGRDGPPVRQFNTDSLKTFLVQLQHGSTTDPNNTGAQGSTLVWPNSYNVGNGSFQAQWTLPAGGSLLGQDIVWETRVRYKTPPGFWFALWTAGNQWRWDNGPRGAEHDLIESYGENYLEEARDGVPTPYGNSNFDGHLWHSNAVPADSDTVDYYNNGFWGGGMNSVGINPYPKTPNVYSPTQYHIWTWVYRHDNTYAMYVDGIQVQSGSGYYWTYGDRATDPPINMDFLFDAGWGHLGGLILPFKYVGTTKSRIPASMLASQLAGTYYEFNYSHVYLSQPYPYIVPTIILPGTVQAVNYETGGQGVAYNQTVAGGQTLYRPDNSGADYGTSIGWTAAGQWYNYQVSVPTAGTYNVVFQVGNPNTNGRCHLEDEAGILTGPITVPNTNPNGDYFTTGYTIAQTVTLPAGPHTLKWVQDGGTYNLFSIIVTPGEAAFTGPLSAGNTTGLKGPHSVPGTIQAEDYDIGGEGFAYHDQPSLSNGGQTGYRPDNNGDARTSATGSSGDALGWSYAGDWYKYTVSLSVAGSYTASFQVAASGLGGTFHLEDESSNNLTGSLPVSGTSLSLTGFDNWQTVTSPPFTLSAGPHVLKLVEDNNATTGPWVFDFDCFTIAAAAQH